MRFLSVAVLFFCMSALLSCAGGETPRRSKPAEPLIRVGMEKFSKWRRVCESERDRPTFLGNKAGVPDSAIAGAWAALHAKLPDASDMVKIREINSFFNNFPYIEDKDMWGVEDHWSAPREFMAHGGDCEDFAIAKYFALRALGMDADRLRIAGVWNKRRGTGHAVLLAVMDGHYWVLDNLTGELLPQEETRRYYIPQYYTNEHSVWRRERVAAEKQASDGAGAD